MKTAFPSSRAFRKFTDKYPGTADCIHLVCLLPYLFLLLFETGCFAATYTAHCGKQRFLPGTFLEKLCFVVSFQCCYAVN